MILSCFIRICRSDFCVERVLWKSKNGSGDSITRLFKQCKLKVTHSSVLAWRIPGTEEPGGLLSMGSHRVGHD